MPNLTNNQIQEQISNAITSIGADPAMDLKDKSLALARLSRAHIQCTRVAVYGSKAALSAGDKEFPDLAHKLQMPVFEE